MGKQRRRDAPRERNGVGNGSLLLCLTSMTHFLHFVRFLLLCPPM